MFQKILSSILSLLFPVKNGKFPYNMLLTSISFYFQTSFYPRNKITSFQSFLIYSIL